MRSNSFSITGVRGLGCTSSILAISVVISCLGPTTALADCTSNAPADGETVYCVPAGGADPVGVSGANANDVTVVVSGPGGGIQSPSYGIELGSGATIRADNDAPIESFAGGINVGDDADIAAGNIVTSGKGSAGVRAGDRLQMVLGEGGRIETTGLGASAISAGNEATITIAGAARSVGTDFSLVNGNGVDVGDAASILVTRTGSIETFASGSSAINMARDGRVEVDGILSTEGDFDSAGFFLQANGITANQGAVVMIREGGAIETYGAQADGIGVLGNVDSYSSPLLADIVIAGQVEASGTQSNGISLSAAEPIFFPDDQRAEAYVDVAETGVVSAADGIGIYDLPFSSGSRTVDTGVRVAGTVEGRSADNFSIYLGAGDDQVILLPTYDLVGRIGGSDDPASFPTDPDEWDVFVLDGAAGTQARFAFNEGGEEQVLGFEEFVKIGDGLWTLDGDDSDFTALGTVEAGALAVDAVLPGLDLLVAAGATLSGNGTLGALEVNGVVSPGNSMGMLTVAGDLKLGASSSYSVELDAAGSADRINAGSATLDAGALTVHATGPLSAYRDGRQSVIVDTATGLTGQFGSVTTNVRSAFLSFDVLYTANQVILEADRRSFAAAAETFNQQQVATALDQLGNDGQAGQIQELLLASSFEQARRAYDLMSGEIYASSMLSLGATSRLFAETLQRRAQLSVNPQAALGGIGPLAYSMGGQNGSLPSAVTAADAVDLAIEPASSSSVNSGIWTAFIGQTAEYDSNGNTSDLDTDSTGVAVGAELWTGAVGGFDLNFGLGAGYTHTQIDNASRLSEAEADAGHVGLYAGAAKGPLSLSGSLAYGAYDVDVERNTAFGSVDEQARSNLDADVYAASAETRYRFDLGQGLSLAPLARMDVAHVRSGEIDENGSDALNLNGGEDSATFGVAGLGGVLGYAFMFAPDLQVTTELSLVYESGFGDEAQRSLRLAGSAAGFEVRGMGEEEQRFAVGLGMGAALTEHLGLTAHYRGAFGSDTQEHTGHISVAYRF